MVKIMTNKNNEMLIDEDDWINLSGFKWYENERGYVERYTRIGSINRKIRLHREVMEFPQSYIDHINRNKLDNRKSNLRAVKSSTNILNAKNYKNNKSGHKGVWITPCGKFHAFVGKKKLGNFETVEEAIKARATELLEKLRALR